MQRDTAFKHYGRANAILNGIVPQRTITDSAVSLVHKKQSRRAQVTLLDVCGVPTDMS